MGIEGGGGAGGSKGKGEEEEASLPFITRLHLLFSNPHVVLFLCTATAFGLGFGTIETFLFVFLAELGGTSTLFGLTLTSECLFLCMCITCMCVCVGLGACIALLA